MKISKGWTLPGTEAYTSRRGDVEVDMNDLHRLLAENGVADSAIALTAKNVFILLDTEADKYTLLQQMSLGAVAATAAKESLERIKSQQSAVFETLRQ